jgi:hypothetical protein
MEERRIRVRTVAAASLVALFVFVAGVASAGTARFDRQMRPIYSDYQVIHRALAADRLAGVDRAAARIAKRASKLDPSTVSGKHAAHYRDLPRKITAAARAVKKAGDLKQTREAFKSLSRPLAMWATMSQPKGINVVYCSMAKASWLQSDATIANPYYGSEMLRCGEIVSGKDKGAASGHMKRE